MSFSTPNIVAFVLIVLCAVVLLYFIRRYGERPAVSLRNIKAYETLRKNVSKAVADGRTIHFSAGRGALETTSNPASLAALAALFDPAFDASARLAVLAQHVLERREEVGLLVGDDL